MANEQKETDLNILLRFIAYCAGTNLLVKPLLIVRQAMDMLEAYRSDPLFHPNAKTYITIAQNIILQKGSFHAYPGNSIGCLVAAATYILIRTDGKDNEVDEKFALDLFSTLSECDDIRFDYAAVGKTIQQIQQYKKTAPPTYNLFAAFDEIAKGKNLAQVDWQKLLTEIDKYHGLFASTYPYYMMLHSFLMQIEYPTRRADVLGYLEDASEKCFSQKKSKEFITEAGWLVSLYTKINTRGINHPMPMLWHDRDLNEFTLLMHTIQPQELVAIAQSMIDAKYVTHEKFGIIPHILRSEKYAGRVVTNRGFDFCQGLYFAQGALEWLTSGEGDAYDQLPSLDTHDMKFLNACYDVFVNCQIGHIRKKYPIEEQRLKKNSDYYQELFNSLDKESKRDNTKRVIGALPMKAYNSLYARLRDLTVYVSQKLQNLRENEAPLYRPIQIVENNTKRIYVGDVILSKHSASSTHVKFPSKKKQKYCTYIVPDAGKTRDEIEADLLRASQKSARTFANLLMAYRRDGYLDFRNEAPADIFEYLRERYELTYSAGNFTRYFH